MATSLRFGILLLLIFVLSFLVSHSARAQASEGLSAGMPDTSDVKERIPDFDDFSAHAEIDPSYDQQDFSRRLKYPEAARRHDIEGRVTVAVYVDKTGKAIKYKIIDSDNDLLAAAAVDAVMGTKFTPGVQDKKPVACWMSFTVNFKLN